MPFGNWAIEKEMYDYLCTILPEGKTILELGSGEGTAELVKRWKVYSIEHDPDWIGKYHDNYIECELVVHKPLKHHEGDLWYSARILEKVLPTIDYDLILVDGPPGPRGGFVKYFNLFKQDVPIIFDDANLNRNIAVMRSVSQRRGSPYTVYNCWNEGKDFGVVFP